MVTRPLIGLRLHPRQRGALQVDLAIAMGILVLALIPIVSTIREERQLCRGLYYRAVAMSIVDGEAEILKAGAWQSYPIGTHTYEVTAKSATNLPKGTFSLKRTKDHIRLSWQPSRRSSGGPVVREFSIVTTP